MIKGLIMQKNNNNGKIFLKVDAHPEYMLHEPKLESPLSRVQSLLSKTTITTAIMRTLQ